MTSITLSLGNSGFPGRRIQHFRRPSPTSVRLLGDSKEARTAPNGNQTDSVQLSVPRPLYWVTKVTKLLRIPAAAYCKRLSPPAAYHGL